MIRAQDYSSNTLVWALLLASFLHLVLVGFLISYDPVDKNKPEKTIPVMIINSAPKQATSGASSAPASESQTLQAPEVVKTTSFASKKAAEKSATKPQKPGTPVPATPSKSEQRRKLPEITKQARQQANQANTTSNQWQSLLKQSPNTTQRNSPAVVRQESTKDVEKLSPYEIKLRQHLSSSELYSPYHSVFIKYNVTQVNLSVSLTLLANGQIKKADFISSSTIEEINSIIRKIIYDANPYPRPPPGDIAKRFTYQVDVKIKPQ